MTLTHRRLLGACALAPFLAPAAASAQGLSITPLAGAYIPASSFADLEGEAETVRVERESSLALGLNVSTGPLRATIRYVTDATLSEEGIDDASAIESGSLLAASADLVLRPFPRLVGFQPYVLGGVGLKRQGYSYADDGVDDLFPDSETDLAFHFGLGAELSAGALALVLEADDFISHREGDFGAHDAFLMAGIKLGL